MTIEHIHQGLQAWGRWVATHPGRLKGLGYPSTSSEARLMRGARGSLTSGRLLPRVWYCDSCQARLVRRVPPKQCRCGCLSFHAPEHVAHGTDAQGKRREPIEDNPEAEAMDRALGKIPPHLRQLVDAAVFKYLRGYSDFLSAKTLGTSERTFRGWVDMLHAWLDAYFTLTGSQD